MRGYLSLDVDLSTLEVNQCEAQRYSAKQIVVFHGTHKCHNDTSKVSCCFKLAFSFSVKATSISTNYVSYILNTLSLLFSFIPYYLTLYKLIRFSYSVSIVRSRDRRIGPGGGISVAAGRVITPHIMVVSLTERRLKVSHKSGKRFHNMFTRSRNRT